MTMERSLVLIKPEAVQRGVVGEILHRFERAGLKIIAVKLVLADDETARKHYPSTDKWFTKVGQNTISDCEKYDIDLMESMGTTDAIEIGKLVKKWNEDYLKSGPVLALIFTGAHAIERIRAITGPTVPVLAPAGTIRGDFSLDSAYAANAAGRAIYNLVHASGSVEEAEEEIALWFNKDEIMDYKRVEEVLYSY